MKNKKGFTLIELLAVIVILAIIMVIAVPQILKVIENSRNNAAKSSMDLLKSGIQTQIASAELTNNPFTKDADGCYTFDFDSKNNNYEKLEVKNKERFSGQVKYCNGEITDTNLAFDGNTGSSSAKAYKCKKTSSLTTGAVVICDVNGDGTFDSTNEKFYYVSDYYDTSSKSFDSNYATLLYAYNTINGEKNTTTNVSYGDTTNGPTTLKTNLPSTSQWSNISLYKSTRNILDQNGNIVVSNFDYSGKAARLLTYQEVVKACNNCNPYASNALNGYEFLFDNLTQVGPYPGYWLETIDNGHYSGAAWLIYGASKQVSITYTYLGDSHTPRPVIDIKKTDIQ